MAHVVIQTSHEVKLEALYIAISETALSKQRRGQVLFDGRKQTNHTPNRNEMPYKKN